MLGGWAAGGGCTCVGGIALPASSWHDKMHGRHLPAAAATFLHPGSPPAPALHLSASLSCLAADHVYVGDIFLLGDADIIRNNLSGESSC